MDLDALLKFMTKKGASDLHLKPTRPPLLRINGKIIPIDMDPCKPGDIEKMIYDILNAKQKQKLEEHLSVDLGYGVHGLARFRGNIYMQRGTLAASFRRIPFQIASVQDLDLPDTLLDFCTINMGLVLVTGPTGSGKSTTLAALIKHISATRPVHVITIEDPMEFLFTDGIATISQREVGTDTVGFREALRNSMRQDPDVIMVGEMRDPETIGTVITAAETGHLVFSTLHTNSATQTVDRILDSFSANHQTQIRAQLAQILKGVVSMKLVQRADGTGRTAALEIMKVSPKISDMVEKGETSNLHEELESSVGYYRMQSTNQSLIALLVNGVITLEEAMEQSPDPEDLSLKLRKMFPKIIEGDDMGNSDFSQVEELKEFRRLYEEQEEKVKLRIAERDEQIQRMQAQIQERDEQIQQAREQMKELAEDQERMQAEYKRLKQEAADKISKAQERIKELSQEVMAARGGSGGQKKSGLFG